MRARGWPVGPVRPEVGPVRLELEAANTRSETEAREALFKLYMQILPPRHIWNREGAMTILNRCGKKMIQVIFMLSPY